MEARSGKEKTGADSPGYISTKDTNTEKWKVSMVRNFYIKGSIDGRKTDISGGSGRKDGGMQLILTQRNEGNIERCASIECVADGDTLKTVIYGMDGSVVYELETRR